jgi:hypothetical protein
MKRGRKQQAVIATLASIAAAALLAGCASGTGRAGGPVHASGGAVPPTGGTGGPPPLPDVSAPAPPSLTPVTPVPGTKERTVRWTLAGRGDGDRWLLVDVTVGGPPCDAVTGVDVVESADAVKVTVYAGATTPRSCTGGVPARVGTVRVRVSLGQPLGARVLVDGAR